MSGDNPKLILDGRKTQTRRIIKLKFPFAAGIAEVAGYHMGTTPTPPIDMRVTLRRGIYHHMDFKTFAEKFCPYGVAGDRLWVREKWAHERQFDHLPPSQIPQSAHDTKRIKYGCDMISGWYKTRPSIHMPRWASRITLEITKVRVERLQDISESDAKAEGIEPDKFYARKRERVANIYRGELYRAAYSVLWDSLHGKGAWDKNPWVWVIEFRLI